MKSNTVIIILLDGNFNTLQYIEGTTMYILSAFSNPAHFCSEPKTTTYRQAAPKTASPAKTYLEEILQAGFTIKLLSEQSKISSSTLYRLRAGKIQKPTNKTFRQLLSIYCRLIILK